MAATNEITICRSTLKILKFSLIWPAEDEEMNPGKWYYIRIVTFVIITLGWCFSVMMHLILTTKNGLEINTSEDYAWTMAFFGLYFMIITYVRNQRHVAQLMADLSNYDDFGKPPGVEEADKKLSFLSVFFFMYTVVGILLLNVIKYLEVPSCEKTNELKGYQENCGILVPVWTPVRVETFPWYHLVVVYVHISAQILMKLTLMISFNMLEIGHHIILRVRHMNSMIITCFDDENQETCKENLYRCIKYHKQILDFCERLDCFFSDGMLAHLTITGLICGCIENQFVKTFGYSKLSAVIHCSGWMWALFLACVGGQHIIDASSTIPEAIYDSKWYQADVDLQKDLSFMLARSQKDLFVRAGAFGIISFPLFVSVMKMSYSILTLLSSK